MSAADRLLLFDIDGTLLDSQGAGAAALFDAVEEIFGMPREGLAPLNLAGATDQGIVRGLLEELGAEHSAELAAAYLACYLGHLERRLAHDSFTGHLLPGVADLLKELAVTPGVHLGLLTGNVRRGADMKLLKFGIHVHFIDGAFGDDAEDRNLLGPVAMERMAALTGAAYEPDTVIVIGDTPKDIACARAIGARCLAVATGVYPADELRAHAPWRCLDSLADTRAVCELLLS